MFIAGDTTTTLNEKSNFSVSKVNWILKSMTFPASGLTGNGVRSLSHTLAHVFIIKFVKSSFQEWLL